MTKQILLLLMLKKTKQNKQNHLISNASVTSEKQRTQLQFSHRKLSKVREEESFGDGFTLITENKVRPLYSYQYIVTPGDSSQTRSRGIAETRDKE